MVKTPEEITLTGLLRLRFGSSRMRLPILLIYAPPEPALNKKWAPDDVVIILLTFVPTLLTPVVGTCNVISPVPEFRVLFKPL